MLRWRPCDEKFGSLGARARSIAAALAAGCVPEGPSTADAGAPSKAVAARTPARVGPAASPHDARSRARRRRRITAVWEDTFDRAELGPDWNALSPVWKIQNGKLCARGARNRGAWLDRRLPVNARIEFDAYAESAEGDIKVELWGDGASGATALSYTNATSYIAILGGWHNTKQVLARINEHAPDRLEIDVDPHSDDERMRAVAPGQPYHFKVERADGQEDRVVRQRVRVLRLHRSGAARGPGARALRLQRLGRAGVLRQPQGHPALGAWKRREIDRELERARDAGSSSSARSTSSTSWASTGWSRSSSAGTSSAASAPSAASRSATRPSASSSTCWCSASTRCSSTGPASCGRLRTARTSAT